MYKINYLLISKLKILDEKYFFSFLKKIINFFRVFRNRKFKIKKILNYNYYIVDYLNIEKNELTLLCEKYGSDKGGNFFKKKIIGSGHTYTDYYYDIFYEKKKQIKNLFECGLGTNDLNIQSNMGIHARPGASLRVWRDFFPEANIFGADIDKKIIFQEERITTFQMDQTNSYSINSAFKNITTGFDIIIDDGLHLFDANICLYENLISKLNPNGYYVIEDVTLFDQEYFYNYFKNSKLKVKFISLNSPAISGSSNLIIVRK